MEDPTKLHDRDFYLWVENQAIAIKNKNLDAVDWENLLEEIEDMGASQKRALRSYYYRLVEHLLKLRNWKEERANNEIKWRIEVTNFRRQIKDILQDSPSLKNYLKDNHINWFNIIIDNYQKNKLFDLEDITAIPLAKMMDDSFFG